MCLLAVLGSQCIVVTRTAAIPFRTVHPEHYAPAKIQPPPPLKKNWKLLKVIKKSDANIIRK